MSFHLLVHRTLGGAVLSFAVGANATSPTQSFPETCPPKTTAHFPSTTPTSIDAACGLKGSAPSIPEALQNTAKNNFCSVNGESKAVKLNEIESRQAAVESLNTIQPGKPPESRADLVKLGEGSLVSFEGYVFEARQECNESVNCGSAVQNVNASHDIHISLIDEPKKPNTNECTAFVAEMIPHHRPKTWTECTVNKVAANGLRVRVTGQLLFDGSHVPCKNGIPVGSNPKRMSLWEIHPIYAFEVCPTGDCGGGGWTALDAWPKSASSCPEKDCKVEK